MAGTMMGFQVWKESLSSKILSSFALTAQPHQNVDKEQLAN